MQITYEVHEVLIHSMILMGFYLLGRISNVRIINKQTQEAISYMEWYREQLLVEKETLKENQELILDLINYQDLNIRLQSALFDANKHRGK